jgi:hypothetical protein
LIGKEAFRIGPFIALGLPGEASPSDSAYRAYLNDAEWQETILTWMREAQLIVLNPGVSRWVEWELERVRDLGFLEKTVVFFPPSDAADRLESLSGNIMQDCIAFAA